jgi:hypothetical protein
VVSKKTGRQVGRPRKVPVPAPSREQKLARKFLTDPDRHAVALLDAILALEMGSKRDCATAIAAQLIGVAGEPPQISIGRPGFICTSWERNRTRRGATAGTLEGRASTLRFKQNRFRSAAEMVWRKNMASAFMLAIGARDPGAAMAAVFERVCVSGDPDPVRSLLMLWGMIGPELQPEFLGQIVSTHTSE